MVWDGIEYFISFSTNEEAEKANEKNQHQTQTPSTRMIARGTHDGETPLPRTDKRTRTLSPPRTEDDMASAISISDREIDDDGAGTTPCSMEGVYHQTW